MLISQIIDEYIEPIEINEGNYSMLDFSKIHAFTFASGGAMGCPGEVIFCQIDRDVKYFSVNWYYDDIMKKVNKDFFQPFMDSLENNSYIYISDTKNFKSITMGMGNSLFIHEDFYDSFIDFVETNYPKYYAPEHIHYPKRLQLLKLYFLNKIKKDIDF